MVLAGWEDNGVVAYVHANQLRQYGAGQPTTTYVDGKFYLLYTDTTETHINPLNGAGQFLIRADDPAFTMNPETFSLSGFVPLAQNVSTYKLFDGFGVDMQYVEPWATYLILSHTTEDQTQILLFDRNFRKMAEIAILQTAWREGPGIVSDPLRHAIVLDSGAVSVDFIRAVGGAGPSSWDLAWRGVDLEQPHGRVSDWVRQDSDAGQCGPVPREGYTRDGKGDSGRSDTPAGL
jgi:hypothetical protein